VFEDGACDAARHRPEQRSQPVLRDENGVALVSASEQLDGSIEVVAAR
jgi:hypothetical protein